MPSQQQLKWSQIKVGITVVVASVVLAVLVFLMSGTTGLFTQKITLYAYFDNAEGLTVGSPVDLQGVNVGNVKGIQVVPGRSEAPVQITMKINSRFQPLIRRDSRASIETAGVLGQAFVDMDNKQSTAGQVRDGDTLPAAFSPQLSDVVRSSQSSLQNFDNLVKHLDHIVFEIDSGKGSIGKVINDPTLYNRLNAGLAQLQKISDDVSNGQGTIGKLLVSDDLYNKTSAAVDKINAIIDLANRGEGTVGMLLKDPSLYRNTDLAIKKTNQILDDINAGRGPLGKLAKDEELARKLDNTITKLSMLADKLNSGEGTVGKMLRDPSMYNNANQVMLEVQGLVKAIRENPKKYLEIHMRIF